MAKIARMLGIVAVAAVSSVAPGLPLFAFLARAARPSSSLSGAFSCRRAPCLEGLLFRALPSRPDATVLLGELRGGRQSRPTDRNLFHVKSLSCCDLSDNRVGGGGGATTLMASGCLLVVGRMWIMGRFERERDWDLALPPVASTSP
ncbi:hypothetical protein B0T14DRAFT_177094 [Immersiella caudata]|uniref:Uncharacterized protein n=1 Tax=Immersiella caudata TaxID=314043 RepID=A0AA39WXK3_9PEZI|nr:hypothetical protein B0T14DRAFT_177094 [Immersiella caudata]